MSIGLNDNERMRWFGTRAGASACPVLPRLEQERAQLERIITTTGNQSIAEMARIKLRVVNFFRSRVDASPQTSPTGSEAGENDTAPEFDLPRPLSIAPAAYLINLDRQRPMLEKIHANAPQWVREPPLVQPDAYNRIEWQRRIPVALDFSASTKRPTTRGDQAHPALLAGVLYSGVVASMALLALADVHPMRTAFHLALLALVLALIAGVALPRTVFDSRLSLSALGVRWNRRLYPWHAVAAITLSVREDDCDCEIELHDGCVIVATLTEFEPNLPAWLSRLRGYLAQGPDPVPDESGHLACDLDPAGRF